MLYKVKLTKWRSAFLSSLQAACSSHI